MTNSHPHHIANGHHPTTGQRRGGEKQDCGEQSDDQEKREGGPVFRGHDPMFLDRAAAGKA